MSAPLKVGSQVRSSAKSPIHHEKPKPAQVTFPGSRDAFGDRLQHGTSKAVVARGPAAVAAVRAGVAAPTPFQVTAGGVTQTCTSVDAAQKFCAEQLAKYEGTEPFKVTLDLGNKPVAFDKPWTFGCPGGLQIDGGTIAIRGNAGLVYKPHPDSPLTLNHVTFTGTGREGLVLGDKRTHVASPVTLNDCNFVNIKRPAPAPAPAKSYDTFKEAQDALVNDGLPAKEARGLIKPDGHGHFVAAGHTAHPVLLGGVYAIGAKNLTINGGRFENIGDATTAHGVYLVEGSSAQLDGCTFKNLVGDPVRVRKGSHVTDIVNCEAINAGAQGLVTWWYGTNGKQKPAPDELPASGCTSSRPSSNHVTLHSGHRGPLFATIPGQQTWWPPKTK